MRNISPNTRTRVLARLKESDGWLSHPELMELTKASRVGVRLVIAALMNEGLIERRRRCRKDRGRGHPPWEFRMFTGEDLSADTDEVPDDVWWAEQAARGFKQPRALHVCAGFGR